MARVIGVRFRYAGKVYYFDPVDLEMEQGDRVIVETARGVECGEVVNGVKDVDEKEVIAPLKKVMRKATPEDLQQVEDNKKKAEEAYRICQEKIQKHSLEMKLIDVEYTFDNNKILFYFTADGRVDFRELVKDLAAVFRTRIELRQIGVRDEAKMMGGLGVCGRSLCCSSHLTEFHPVSIKMAKEQSLSLNPTKISGTCGRLMCCLKYEQDAYEDLLKRIPKAGALVQTPHGTGTIMYVSLLEEKVKVKLDNENEPDLQEYRASEVKLIKDVDKASTEPELELEVLKQLED
ncbi:MAG: stage 0 sporulation family protein [Ruminiclostridium sp.]|nr:stage 0 sporulation family protein [Ruminiclostridium sp.]